MADGSAASPFRTIADALAAGAAEICLSAGEHESPGIIERSVVLRGADPVGGLPVSGLVSPAGGCVAVSGLDATDLRAVRTVDVEATLVSSGENVTVEDVSIRGGCDHAVVVRGGSTRFVRLRVEAVRVGVAVDRGASASIEGSFLATVFDGDAPDLPMGVYLGTGSDVEMVDTEVSAGDWGWGVDGAPDRFVTRGSTVRNAFAGLMLGGADALATTIEIGEGTLVHELRTLGFGSDRFLSVSVIRGARSVRIEGARFEADRPDALGLQLTVVDSASIERTMLRGFDYAALSFAGGELVIGEGVTLEPARAGVGLAVGTRPEVDLGPTSVRIDAALESTGSDEVRHVLVQGVARFEAVAPLTLRGGLVGVQALDEATVTGAAMLRVEDVSGAGVQAKGTATIEWDGLEVMLAEGATGFDLVDDARGDFSNVLVSGGRFGLQARDGSTLAVADARVSGASEAGVVIAEAGPESTLTDVTIVTTPLGLSVREGRSIVARGLVIEDTAGSAVEVVRASLDVEGGRVERANGAALAFEDSSGRVHAMIIRATAERADGRADEVRIVATDGVERSVDVGANMFFVDDRTCLGGCSVVLASGAGAVGIVRPNCLMASVGTMGTYTLAEQDGGRLDEPEATDWDDALLGRGVGLGWLAGSTIGVGITPPLPSTNLDLTRLPPAP